MPATPVTMVTVAPVRMATSVSAVKALREQTVNAHSTALQPLNGQRPPHPDTAAQPRPPWSLTLLCPVREPL